MWGGRPRPRATPWSRSLPKQSVCLQSSMPSPAKYQCAKLIDQSILPVWIVLGKISLQSLKEFPLAILLVRFSPRVEPLRYFFVTDCLPGFQFGNTRVKLATPPLFGLDVRGDRLGCVERFRAFRALRKGAQALLNLGINPYRECLSHQLAPVCIHLHTGLGAAVDMIE